MRNVEKLKPFLPQNTIQFVENLIGDKDDLEVNITKPRFSKWGDFRKLNGHFIISLNSNLNPYQFLITLLHEYAHYTAFKKFGPAIKPHGKEWKNEFRDILMELVKTNLLPYDLNQAIIGYAVNPRAAVTTDLNLKKTLEKYSFETIIKPATIEEVEPGNKFIFNGRIFERMEKRRKLIKCRDVKKNKLYLFQPDTIVKKL